MPDFDFPKREDAVIDYMARTVSPVVGKRVVQIKVGPRGATLFFEDESTLDIHSDVFTNLSLSDFPGLTYGYTGPEGEGFATAGWLFHEQGGGIAPPGGILKRWSPR